MSDILDTEQAGPAAVRGGVLRVAGYGAGILLSAASAIALFRYLGPADAGRYFTVIALLGVVAGLTDAGLTGIGVRELSARRGAQRATVMQSLLGLRIVLTLLGAAVATGYTAVAGYGGTLVAGTALAGLGLVLTNLQAALSVSLMSRLRLGWVTLLDLARQLATVTLILALVAADGGLVPLLSVPVPAALLALALTVPVVRGDVPLRPRFDRREWWELLRDTLPYAAATAVGALYFRIALLVTSLIAGERETGFLSGSFRIVEVLIVVPQLAVGAAFPILARAAVEDRERLAYGTGRVFDACLIVGAGTALGVGVGAPVAIDVIAGDDFGPSVDVLRIQAVGLGCAFVVAVWGYVLLSLRRHAALLWMNLGALAVAVGLTALLVPGSGAEGAGVATAAAEVLMLVAGAVLVGGALRPSLARVPRVLLAALAGVAPALAGLPALPATVLGLAVYAVMLFALRAVPSDLVGDLRRLAGARS